MKEKLSDSIIFLGISEHIETNKYPYPIGPLSIFRLSRMKVHFLYPLPANGYYWLFLINGSNLIKLQKTDIQIDIISDQRLSFGSITIDPELKLANGIILSKDDLKSGLIYYNSDWDIVYINNKNLVIRDPGKYRIVGKIDSYEEDIGIIEFIYTKVEPYSPEKIMAIESNPDSIKQITIDIGCKHCPSKYLIYSGIKRNYDLEKEGYIWQYNIPEDTRFICDCGQTNQPLKYYRESCHGLLREEGKFLSGNLSYTRRYAHDEIIKIINKFNKLLEIGEDEKHFQLFIEKHPVLLARFHAKKLFIKPRILGKFVTDFVILNWRNELILIELERPMRLFKKNGHPTADLNHAYNQIQDWLHECQKHLHAVIDGLNLSADNIMSIKGSVIAGRSSKEEAKFLQRHLSNPPYANIEFITLDDLSLNLLQLSKDLI